MIKMRFNKKLEGLFTKKQPIIVVIGGRGSGKSLGIVDFLLFKMETENADVLCLREFQQSLSDSVHRVFVSGIEDRLKLTGWEIQRDKVVSPNGAVTSYKGCSRNVDSIQSAQNFKYAFMEESQTISEETIDKLLPTIIRNKGAQCIFAANPQSSGDAFSKRFILPYKKALDRDGYYEDDLHYIIKINYTDNPFWNDELEQMRSWSYENESRAKYNWIWEGDFNDTIENSIIKPEWFDAAIDAHIKLGFTGKGALIASHDPSDLGPDSKGYALRHGSVFLDIQEKTTGDINEGCDWALDLAIRAQADHLVFDCDGMGVALKRPIDQAIAGKKIEPYMFKGSHSPDNPDEVYQGSITSDRRKEKTNKETFKNKRAQYYIRLRDRFYNTYRAVEKGEYIDPDEMISISSTLSCLTALRSEICRIPLKDNGSGLIQIMSKPEMKKMGIESPNLADSLMMSMIIPEAAVAIDLSFDSEW